MSTDNPFQVGDTVHMNLVPPGVADVTVKGLGTCDEDGCSDRHTIVFDDPQSGEPDEGHASDFTLVRR